MMKNVQYLVAFSYIFLCKLALITTCLFLQSWRKTVKSTLKAAAWVYVEIQILVASCDPCISELLLETSRRMLQGPFKVMAILHHFAE